MRGVILIGALLFLALCLWSLQDPGRSDTLDAAPDERAPSESPMLGSKRGPEVSGSEDATRNATKSSNGDTSHPPVDLEAAKRRGDVHGVVLDGGGSPLAGANLRIVRYPWRRGSILAADRYDEPAFGASTHSATDGTFALPLRQGESACVNVRLEGYASLTRKNLTQASYVKLVLQRGVALHVTTQGENGDLLSSVSLELSLFGSGGDYGQDIKATTDADGKHTFLNLPPGWSFRISANDNHLGGWMDDYESHRLPETGSRRMTLTIPKGRLVTGTVTDAVTGRAIAGARVGMGWVFHKETRTNEDGHYALGGWTGNGYHDIHVLAEGYARASNDVVDKQVLDFSLHPGFTVRGRAVNGKGDPLAGARVSVVGSKRVNSRQSISTAHGVASDDGSFSFGGLTPSIVHSLVIQSPGYGRYLTDFDAPVAPASEVDLGEIVVPRGVALTGAVVDAEGAPRSRLYVSIRGANDDAGRLRRVGGESVDLDYGREEETWTGADGQFAFSDLAPGSYIVQAGMRGDVVTQSMTLRAGSASQSIRIQFPPTHALSLCVVNEDGKPVKEAFFRIEPEGGEETYNDTGADGRISFVLPQRVTRALVAYEGGLVDSKEAYLTPDPMHLAVREKEYTIVLNRAAVVRGVLLADDRPLERAFVRAQRGGRQVDSATTDGKGAFRLLVTYGGTVDIQFRGNVMRRAKRGYRNLQVPWVAQVLGVKAGGPPVTLRAKRVAKDLTLTVRVEDATGAPVKGATIDVRPMPTLDAEHPKTNERGMATITELMFVPLLVNVYPPKAERNRLGRMAVKDVRPSEETLTVVLKPPQVMSGVVVDMEGRPVEGADVQVYGQFAGFNLKETTDAQGEFRLYVPADFKGRLEISTYKSLKDGTMLMERRSGVDLSRRELKFTVRPRNR